MACCAVYLVAVLNQTKRFKHHIPNQTHPDGFERCRRAHLARVQTLPWRRLVTARRHRRDTGAGGRRNTNRPHRLRRGRRAQRARTSRRRRRGLAAPRRRRRRRQRRQDGQEQSRADTTHAQAPRLSCVSVFWKPNENRGWLFAARR